MNESRSNDPLEELEAELSHLRPQRLSRDLSARIAAQLDEPARLSIADRCLMMFMGAGALAACLIVGLIGWQLLEERPPRLSSPAIIAQHPPASIGEYQQALAQANGPALEIFR